MMKPTFKCQDILLWVTYTNLGYFSEYTFVANDVMTDKLLNVCIQNFIVNLPFPAKEKEIDLDRKYKSFV